MSSNINELNVAFEPYEFYDAVTDDEIYIGSSAQAITTVDFWRIKKFWTVGSLTKMGFPNGNQNFKFVWDDRASYTYS